jgi:hypothetical protein
MRQLDVSFESGGTSCAATVYQPDSPSGLMWRSIRGALTRGPVVVPSPARHDRSRSSQHPRHCLGSSGWRPPMAGATRSTSRGRRSRSRAFGQSRRQTRSEESYWCRPATGTEWRHPGRSRSSAYARRTPSSRATRSTTSAAVGPSTSTRSRATSSSSCDGTSAADRTAARDSEATRIPEPSRTVPRPALNGGLAHPETEGERTACRTAPRHDPR